MSDAATIDEAIRSRRTHKVFGPDPLDRDALTEILELARWAPNHKLTNPWRFRVLGPQARETLKRLADEATPGSGAKLDRAPTLICASAVLAGDEQQRREDLLASAAACYIVLLAAHARGLAGYWRTVAILETPAARAELSIPDQETPIGLLHLGRMRQQQRVPERAPVEDIIRFLP